MTFFASSVLLRRVLLSLGTLSTSVGAQFQSVPAVVDGTLPAMELAAPPAAAQAVGKPQRIRIPAIGVDAPVIPVGVNGKGDMDVSSRPDETAWYEPGARPGEDGTAVINGHLELGGDPAVFWRLRDVAVGDEVTVEDEQGVRRTFRVTQTEQYHVDAAPREEIFKKKGGRYLHLITCAGVWRKDIGHYDERRIIYAELIDEPLAVASSA